MCEVWRKFKLKSLKIWDGLGSDSCCLREYFIRSFILLGNVGIILPKCTLSLLHKHAKTHKSALQKRPCLLYNFYITTDSCALDVHYFVLIILAHKHTHAYHLILLIGYLQYYKVIPKFFHLPISNTHLGH